MGETSAGVTLPKSELRAEGCIDENDEVVEQQMLIKYEGDGEWTVKKADSVSA